MKNILLFFHSTYFGVLKKTCGRNEVDLRVERDFYFHVSNEFKIDGKAMDVVREVR